MPSVQHQTPVTLPVHHLPSSTSFYLSALQPLGYRFISKVQHQTVTASSDTVGLGPENTSRVDLFLSQSRHKSSPGGKPAHIVFPAYSKITVRDFYSAALDAGGKPISPPERRSASDNLFSAIVADLDGNKLEVCYCDDVTKPHKGNSRYPAAVMSSQRGGSIEQIRRDVADGTIGSPVVERDLPEKKTIYPVDSSRSRPPPRRPARRNSTGGSNRPPQTSTVEVSGGKTVVGTILGAAAGVAVAYALSSEEKDSRRREDSFAARMEARDRVKAEAEEHVRRSDQSQGVERRKSDRPQSSRDRDSGYFSGGSQRRITYPLNSAPGGPRRSSSCSGEGRGPPKKSATMPARSSSLKNSRNTYYSTRGTSPPRSRGQPSPPPGPATRSRRSSGAGDQRPPSRRPTNAKGPPPTTRGFRGSSPASGTRTPRQSDYYPPPPSNEPPPPPASQAQSQRSAKDAAPSQAVLDPEDDIDSGNELDDLDTIVPDDSISVAPSVDRVGRRSTGRRSGGSKSKGSPRRGKMSRSGREGVVAG